MSLHLFETVQSYLTPDLIRRISTAVNETPEKTFHAMSSVIPAVLAGILDTASSAAGASKMMQMVTGGRFSEKLSTFTSDGSGPGLTSLFTAGEYALNGAMGSSKLGTITESISHSTGIRQGSVTSLMSLVTPMLLGILGSQIKDKEILSATLPAVLAAERESVAKQLPSGIEGLFSWAKAPITKNLTPRVAWDAGYAEAIKPNRAALWLAPLLLLAGLLGLFNWLRTPDQTRARFASITLPGGSMIRAAETSINYAVATYLAQPSRNDVPRRFVFDNLNFPSAATQPTEASLPVIRDLATILSAYSDVRIRLEGHTDNLGESGANKELSLQRAESVKALLVQNNVDSSRIETVGLGSDSPIDVNDTEEGRRRNRRTELLVVQKSR